MKSRPAVTLLTILLGFAGGANATIEYSLTSTSDFGNGSVRVESFAFLTQGYLTADRLFAVEELEPGCRMGFGDACGSVQFVVDTVAAGWGGPAGYSGFMAMTAIGGGTFYYFPRDSIATLGTHYSFANGGMLSVAAVPEPGSLILMLSGGVLVASAKRASRRSESPARAT